MKKVLVCVGTRPNFIKITQLEKAFRAFPDIEYRLLHTGQHFDANMSGVFFQELGIRPPDVSLGVDASGQIGVIAQIMERFDAFVSKERPDLVMVPGDVNSTFACAFVASRHGIPVAHIESGLRSFDMRMPEEANRMLVDAVSDLLFVTEPSGLENLRREGQPESKVRYVGNTMIDSLVAFMPAIDRSDIRARLGVSEYFLVTFHRPGNVDERESLTRVARILERAAQRHPVVFPIHPRTRKRFQDWGLEGTLGLPGLVLTDPLGYLDFLCLAKNARGVLTDSGGVQEETTYLGVPCITIRPNTERPVTISEGTNVLCELDADAVDTELAQINAGTRRPGRIPHLWDGQACERIANEVQTFLT
jgi:UDP-N-acetylglucosamine 2-epimerase (non-hydrolysing)